MPEIVSVNVDVYVFRRNGESVEYLLLRRAPDRLYGGSWRMVAGKIEENEQAWQAAVRELWEETGLHPTELFAIPSMNRFYEWQTDRIHLIPAFAACVEGDPALNAEHDRFEWLGLGEAESRLPWPEQQRLLRLADDVIGGRNQPPSVHIPV